MRFSCAVVMKHNDCVPTFEYILLVFSVLISLAVLSTKVTLLANFSYKTRLRFYKSILQIFTFNALNTNKNKLYSHVMSKYVES